MNIYRIKIGIFCFRVEATDPADALVQVRDHDVAEDGKRLDAFGQDMESVLESVSANRPIIITKVG